MRINIAPSTDDDVFRTASQIHRAPNHIGHVPRVEPGAMEETARGLRVTEIATRRRGPLKLQTLLQTLTDFMASGVYNADLIARQGLSTGHKVQGGSIVFIGRHGAAGAHKRLALDSIDVRGTAQDWKGNSERSLGETIDRRHGLWPKAIRRKTLAEMRQRHRTDGFGSVKRHTPGTEVKAFQVTVVDPPGAEVVGKVGTGRERATVLVDRPQPACWPCQKSQRRHQHQRIRIQ